MAYKDDTWLSLEAMADPRNKETQMVLEAQSNGHILLLHKEIVPFFTQQISKITGKQFTLSWMEQVIIKHKRLRNGLSR